MSESNSVEVQAMPTPVPMSFPAILRNSKLSDRYSYLRESETIIRDDTPSNNLVPKRKTREDKEGKRWVRRRENARFTGNPYVVFARPGSRDMQIDLPTAKNTFPEPLPNFLPRSVAAPTPARPLFDPASANAGRYSMSLKGMRRTLRGHGPRAERLVHDVEEEVLDWLVGGTILNPDEAEDVLVIPGRSVGFEGSNIVELSRTPLQLIWSVEQDAFARYIVHCCARYHKVVSYSKDVDGRRLTYLLRPNVTRPDYTLRDTLDTPPATESDYSLSVLSESDILSVEEHEHDSLSEDASDAEIPIRMNRHRRLSSVSEHSLIESGAEDFDNTTPSLKRIREGKEGREGQQERQKEQKGENEIGSNVSPTPSPSRPLLARTNRDSSFEDINDADVEDDKSIVNVDLAQSIDSIDLNGNNNLNYNININANNVTEPPIRFTLLFSDSPSDSGKA
ncbi:hypothetical protein PNOK_0558900 [Pyrrhoderma noxium]|uniref:Uncharacterized protein n=1 Tax=Pyrrhoderma noxium TaxID=2282107 RepID=A0A286UGJ7_9AGAM|nr:hypothetical protein PNOK_0558900 [Pyrrhoderma noxium]